MTVPYTFGNATTSIPLSNLDADFATPITLGNTNVYLGNTTTNINNLSLGNVSITSVGSTFPNSYLSNSSATLGNAVVTLGGTTTSVGNLTLTNVTISSVASTLPNSYLANSSVTINGTSVALGGSATITANAAATLTISTGLSGTSYNGGTAVTIAIDSTVATLTGTQTLTNKTINGSNNTLSNIPNSALTNNTVTVNGTSIALGASGTVTAAAGTLTGTTLNSTVVTSSLTSVGTITTGVWNGTAIGNTYLANSSVTVNGTSIALGASGTVTAAAGTLTGTTLNSTVVTSSLTSVGTIATGTWNGSIITGTYGGTGVNNGSNTITIAGNLSHTGAFTQTIAATANTSVTLPTSGTIISSVTALPGAVTGTPSSSNYLRGDGTWSAAAASGVSSFTAGTTGFTPSTATTGAVTLAGTLATTNGGTGLTSFTSGGVVYASSTSALATGSALTFDGSNLGLGVTPSASTIAQFEGGSNLLMVGRGNAYLSNNATYNSGFKYINTAAAGQYNISGGVHSWYNAPSGTAGNAISFTQAMTLDASGNLGVGTTSPSAKLSITNSNATYSLSQKIFNASAGTFFLGQSPSATFLSVDNFAMAFCTNSDGGVAGTSVPTNERMRIDSSGNLLVGTTSQITSGKQTISYGGGTNNGLILSDSTNTSSTQYLGFNLGATGIGSVVRVGATSAVVYNTTSDYRLKTVVGAVTGQGARIDALKPIDYLWTESGQQARGFLAHEFQEVYANSVTGTKDAVDTDGKLKYQAMQASSSEVIADLVAEIQSLRKRLADAGIA